MDGFGNMYGGGHGGATGMMGGGANGSPRSRSPLGRGKGGRGSGSPRGRSGSPVRQRGSRSSRLREGGGDNDVDVTFGGQGDSGGELAKPNSNPKSIFCLASLRAQRAIAVAAEFMRKDWDRPEVGDDFLERQQEIYRQDRESALYEDLAERMAMLYSGKLGHHSCDAIAMQIKSISGMAEMTIKQHQESMDPAYSHMIDQEGAPYYAWMHDKDHPHYGTDGRSSFFNNSGEAERKKQQAIKKQRRGVADVPTVEEDHVEALAMSAC